MPALCPWGQLAWLVSTSLTSPASRAGSLTQTPTARSVAALGLCSVPQSSQTKPPPSSVVPPVSVCHCLGSSLAHLWQLAKTWLMTALGLSMAAVRAAEQGWSWAQKVPEVWSGSLSCVHWNSPSTSHRSNSVSKGRRANSSSCNYLPKLIPLQFQSAALDIPSSGCNPSS